MILLTTLVIIAQSDFSATEPRIFKGKTAEPYAYPFMISVYNSKYGGHKCGGVIIDELNVLTAAHCTTRAVARDLKVLTGDYINNYRDYTQVK